MSNESFKDFLWIAMECYLESIDYKH